jgi:hypothetical protein
MRVPTASKIAVLVALALSTSWVTRAMVGQTGSPRKRSGTPQTPPRVRADETSAHGTTETVVADLKRLPAGAVLGDGLQGQFDGAPEAIPPNLVNYGGADAMRATVNGRNVTVAVKASLIETSPEVYYLWSVRVYDGSNKPKVLSEHYYGNQIFKIALRERARPTFSDSFDLEPGTYRVQVALHRLKEGFDVSRLADEAVRGPTLVLGPISTVTVAN